MTAVDGISFALEPGSCTALLGGNGAGKTTTISTIMGLVEPTSGQVTVLGANMPRQRHLVLHRMNFESPYVNMPMRLTVRQNLDGVRHAVRLRRRRRPHPHARRRTRPDRFPGPADGQAVVRPEDARRARQIADQPARPAAARRADRVARSRHRRLGAQQARALPRWSAAPPSCSPRTTWARSNACATASSC